MKQCKHNLKMGVQNFGLQQQANLEWLQDLMKIIDNRSWTVQDVKPIEVSGTEWEYLEGKID